MASSLFTLSLFLLSLHVSAKVVLEDGYTVTTVLSGHKLNINPRSVLPKPGSSDLIILDSVNNVFYTVQFPVSNESVVKRFSGDGSPGYSDGDVGSARFKNPRSFAVDLKGNVYVADKMNHVIRKISGSANNGPTFCLLGALLGVTTIAGGYSRKAGSKDGDGQNASFSEDFELTFIPGACALLVSDRGTQLIRQINLKEEDCTVGSNSGLGADTKWTLGLGLLCLLLGIIIGIALRHYIIRHEGTGPCHSTKTWKHCLVPSYQSAATWKHCLVHLANQVQILCFGIRSVVARGISIHALLSRLWRLILSYILLMFSICNRRPHQETVSLIDLDACSSGEIRNSSKYDDQLKDMISFDEGSSLDVTNKAVNQGYDNYNEERSTVFSGCHGIDKRVQSNLSFAGTPDDKNLLLGSSVCNMGMVKRR